MDGKKSLLIPMGAWYVVGGIVTIITALTAVLLEFKLGVVLAIPAFIVLIVIGSMELSAGRAIRRKELGSWRDNLNTSILTLLIRVLLIYILWGGVVSFTDLRVDLNLNTVLFYANVVLGIGELALFIVLSRHPEYFMQQECEGDRPDLASCKIKSMSECPNCHEVVETYWQSCPNCGTKLPRICGECGGDLGELLSKCPHCGAEVIKSLSMTKTIDMFRNLVKEAALPETKATYQARLAEALLKNGQSDEAIEAYRQAIALTSYPRKRTNFMVQAARILKNTGHNDDAMKLLNDAMTIDPADVAGAAKVKAEIGAKPSSG